MRYDLALHPATVTAIEDATPDVRSITITPDGAPSQRYTPGSHINVRVMIDGRQDLRSYSLVGEPDPTGYRIAVKRRSDSRGGSRYMWSLRAGDRISVSHPNNLFDLEYGRPEYLLIAGGIGITPLYGMALALNTRGEHARLLYAGRTRTDLPFVEELRHVLGDRLEMRVADEGSRIDLEREIEALEPGATMYVCGPMRLLDAARRAWAASGRPLTLLRYETFGSSGNFAPEPFWVRVPGVDREIVVAETASLLETLRSEGIDVVSDCERGECGICQLTILEIDGEIDHRDVFFSDEERDEGHKMCVCVSRIVGGGVVLDAMYRPDAPVV